MAFEKDNAMRTHMQRLRTASAAGLLVLSLGALADNNFTLHGRSVQIVPSGDANGVAAGAPREPGKVFVRDLASGQVVVYASGLIVTLKNPRDLQAVLRDHPAISLQYAPGVYAYVQVANDALAATFTALSADPRVAAVHLRPLPARVKAR